MIDLVSKNYNNLSKFALNEYEQRLQLRKQLKTLARQHQNLETIAIQSTTTNNNHKQSTLFNESLRLFFFIKIKKWVVFGK